MDSRKQYYIVGDAQVAARYTNDNIFGALSGLCRIVPLEFDRESTFHLINTRDIVHVFETKLEAHHYARSLRTTRGDVKLFHPNKILMAPVIEIEIDESDIEARIGSHTKMGERLDIDVHTQYASFFPTDREVQIVSYRKIQFQDLGITQQHLKEIYFPDSGFPAQLFPRWGQENKCVIS